MFILTLLPGNQNLLAILRFLSVNQETFRTSSEFLEIRTLMTLAVRRTMISFIVFFLCIFFIQITLFLWCLLCCSL